MMFAPKISVIIPVYKVEKYLECCLDSVRNQTFEAFEAILIDDGSPDRCPEICDRYADMDQRFVVVHKENGGVASARNAGLDVSHGDYICFVDSDDYIEPDYLKYLFSLVDGSDFDFVSCAANFVNESNERIRRNDYTVEQKVIDEDIFETYFHTNFIEDAPWNKIYRKELFAGLRFTDGLIFEDSEIIIRLLKKCKKILFTSRYLYNYRIRVGSILDYTSDNIHSHAFNPKKMDLLTVYQLCADELKGTKWAKSYYRRMVYTCAEYSVKSYGLHDKDLRKIILAFYRFAVQKYGLSNFSTKERLAIILQVFWPRLWKLRS